MHLLIERTHLGRGQMSACSLLDHGGRAARQHSTLGAEEKTQKSAAPCAENVRCINPLFATPGARETRE